MMSETDPEKSNLLPELSNCKKSVGVESKHSANLNPVSEKLTLQQPQKCNKPILTLCNISIILNQYQFSHSNK